MKSLPATASILTKKKGATNYPLSFFKIIPLESKTNFYSR